MTDRVPDDLGETVSPDPGDPVPASGASGDAGPRPVHPGTSIPVPEKDMRGREVPLPGTPEYLDWFPTPKRPLTEEDEARRLRHLANGTRYRISRYNTLYTGARADSEASDSWVRPVPKDVIPPVKCSSTNSHGEPCGNYAVVGHHVCRVHGGQLPSVRQAAQRRITNLTDKAISTLEDLLDPVHSDHVRRQAASDLLDRAGFKTPDITLEINAAQESNPNLDAAITSALAARFPDHVLPPPDPSDPDPENGDPDVIDVESYEAPYHDES